MPRTIAVAAALTLAAALGPATATAAGAQTLDAIAERGVIRLGYETETPPFSSIEEGRPVGYSIDLCLEVAEAVKERLGRADLRTEFVAIDAPEPLGAVERGEVDLPCAATAATLSARERVDFSLLTFVTGTGLMVRQDAAIDDFKDLAGRRVGVRRGAGTEQDLRRALGPDFAVEAVAFDDHDEAVGALRDGGIDGYFADRALLIGLLEDHADAGLVVADQILSFEPYALPLRRGDSDFRLLVDRTLARLYRGREIGEVFSRWFEDARASDLLRAMYRLQALPE
ncbi:MAG TPA: amino acid ABC transporter substrate-binding protein [Geminicoccaceae bacterium]|nr:amino acid ABC transporter substrate-binding protein [Geminicoccaceae bacterium]